MAAPSIAEPIVQNLTQDLDLSHEALARVLDLAAQVKRTPLRFAQSLSGRYLSLLFEKPSLRTRSTFEIAVRELGADTLHLPSHFAEGVREPLEDVARNLERWVRALVIRTYGQEKALRLANAGKALTVVNALTDEEHPCQALADVMTMQERSGAMAGRGQITSSSRLWPAIVYSWIGTIAQGCAAFARTSGTPFRRASASQSTASSLSTSRRSISPGSSPAGSWPACHTAEMVPRTLTAHSTTQK